MQHIWYVLGILFGRVTLLTNERKVPAREHPRRLEPIHNWSPTSDFVVIPTSTSGLRSRQKADSHSKGKSSSGSNGSNGSNAQPSANCNRFSWPDRIFACSGRGKSGSIAELRYGLEARLTMFLQYEDYIKQSWVLPDVNENSHFFLLSLTDQSALLNLSNDYASCSEVAETETWLDLSTPTILVEQSGEYIVQITEAGINISNAPLQES